MQDKLKEKVQALIEQRVVEATKKQVTQKLLMIAKYLGKPIISQSTFGDKYFDPYYREEEMIYDDKLSVQDPDEWTTVERGYHFDGLKVGINLVITSQTYDEKVSELKATYNGYLVFAEVEGELKAYAPFPVWEDAVNMFHEAAIQVEKKRLVEQRVVRIDDNRQKMEGFWNKFRMLWGY